ncbi:MAG TPA: xanthine dehydrogenase family protein subunit M [Candidatus Binataceae bacterium]|nr:xanthine dehydrogenase family protein subunit M [Candidatus Binataceae bacterium]
MNKFTIVTPADLAHASALVAKPNHSAIAGGVDVLDLMKQGIATPAMLVNLKGLSGLDGIELKPGGELRLGALAKLHEVAANRDVQARFTAISDAAGEAATPQIRNLGTVGGNLLQRPRCWYFRNPLVNCLKKGGEKCYSIGGLNRYHAILGGGPSYIVHPSNLAPALIAYGASARMMGPEGERTVALEKFFTLPEVDPKRENDLGAGEIITEVIVPAPAPGARGVYLEVREKQSFDWPLVSVAVVIVPSADRKTIRDARVVMGAVAPIPWRAPAAEKAIIGAPLDEAHARAAADAALAQAQPMSDNAYKVAIAKAIVRRAILAAGGAAEG